jgi:hypothetical protein
MKSKNWENIHQECLTWSKWMALYEAVNLISDKAQEKGIPFEHVELKPLAIHKYMEMTENLFLRKILKQEHNIDICYDENYNNFHSPNRKPMEFSF